jgi:hypothetical protein
MIKKYNNFIRESNWYKGLEIQEIIDKIGSEYGIYYSELCKTNKDPEKDFENFQKKLDETGWTISKIRREHTDDELISLYRALDSVNGLVDIYFFFLFKKLGLENIVSLGGSGWEDYNVVEDEAFIRYSYGYHNTKYGLLAILNFGTIDDFIKQAISYLQDYLYSGDLSINLLVIYNKKGGFRELTGESSWDIINIKEYSISEEDRLIIFTKEIADFLNGFPLKGGTGTLSDVLKIDSEDISMQISKFLEKMNLDIDFTGKELIIWSEFKES